MDCAFFTHYQQTRRDYFLIRGESTRQVQLKVQRFIISCSYWQELSSVCVLYLHEDNAASSISRADLSAANQLDKVQLCFLPGWVASLRLSTCGKLVTDTRRRGKDNAFTKLHRDTSAWQEYCMCVNHRNTRRSRDSSRKQACGFPADTLDRMIMGSIKFQRASCRTQLWLKRGEQLAEFSSCDLGSFGGSRENKVKLSNSRSPQWHTGVSAHTLKRIYGVKACSSGNGRHVNEAAVTKNRAALII